VLNFNSINYDPKVIDLAAYDDAEVNVALEEMPILLKEVVIQDQANRDISISRIGLTQLSVADIKFTPALLGEVDLVRQVQTLPGVTTVGEGATGFNVRGGSVDQNLILYDGMPVFNSSHVFGFFTAFNPEAVNEVSFYRGGIPAEYGGRNSSILDIRSKDGNAEKWHGSGGVGMITSHLMVNGPLKNKKTTLAISLRSTYSNWLVHAVRTDYADLGKSSLFFYDGTTKITHRFTNNTKLSLTGYSSHDSFSLTGDTTFRWSNLLAAAKLDHQFSTTLSSEFSAGVSSYGYNVINADYRTASRLSYKIVVTTLKAGFHYQVGDHRVGFGVQLAHYGFSPGKLRPESPVSNASNRSLPKQYAIENALYISDELTVGERLTLEGGLRLPLFLGFGRANVNVYPDSVSRDVTRITDTLYFHRGEIIKVFFGIEPRLSLRFMMGEHSSVKLGYHRMYQNLHLVTNSTAVTPVDIWQPSGYYLKPQRADQLAFGYFANVKEKKYSLSAEVFYKIIHNVVDFKDGADLTLNNHLETELSQGKGLAYGIETAIVKNFGRLTGTVNYTYSRAFRQISSTSFSDGINDGKQYPANFDQPHIGNLMWKYNISKRYFFTGNFTFHSGRPVTIPLSAFSWENSTVSYFSERNSYRILDYHRLDLSFVIEGNHRRKKKWDGSWAFSVYNVYGRRNPYSVFFKNNAQGQPRPYQLSVIGTILPSISYNFKF
jgi:hypothetical protein